MNIIYQTALRYIECEVHGKKINIPYMINQNDRFCSAQTKGKAPINEIIEEFETKIKEEKLDIFKFSPEKLSKIMRTFGIGIDCSGFAYHILDPYVKMKTKKYLDHFLLRFSGLVGKADKILFNKKRYQKISAAMLTSNLNTTKVDQVLDIQIGDIIQMTHKGWKGKHPLVIVDVTLSYILYAHSSEYVETNGAHFGKIIIHDKYKDISQQEWLEKTLRGDNYGQDAFQEDLGDSVRRLKCLTR